MTEGKADRAEDGLRPTDDTAAPAGRDSEDADGPEEEAAQEAAEEEAEEQAEEEVEEAAAALSASGVADRIASGEVAAGEVAAGEPVRPSAAERDARRGRTATGPPMPTAEPETLPWVDDNASKVWVVVIAVVFAAIFLNAIFLGQHGLLTRTPSPSPSPTISSPSPSASVSASPTLTSPTAAPSPSGS